MKLKFLPVKDVVGKATEVKIGNLIYCNQISKVLHAQYIFKKEASKQKVGSYGYDTPFGKCYITKSYSTATESRERFNLKEGAINGVYQVLTGQSWKKRYNGELFLTWQKRKYVGIVLKPLIWAFGDVDNTLDNTRELVILDDEMLDKIENINNFADDDKTNELFYALTKKLESDTNLVYYKTAEQGESVVWYEVEYEAKRPPTNTELEKTGNSKITRYFTTEPSGADKKESVTLDDSNRGYIYEYKSENYFGYYYEIKKIKYVCDNGEIYDKYADIPTEVKIIKVEFEDTGDKYLGLKTSEQDEFNGGDDDPYLNNELKDKNKKLWEALYKKDSLSIEKVIEIIGEPYEKGKDLLGDVPLLTKKGFFFFRGEKGYYASPLFHYNTNYPVCKSDRWVEHWNDIYEFKIEAKKSRFGSILGFVFAIAGMVMAVFTAGASAAGTLSTMGAVSGYLGAFSLSMAGLSMASGNSLLKKISVIAGALSAVTGIYAGLKELGKETAKSLGEQTATKSGGEFAKDMAQKTSTSLFERITNSTAYKIGSLALKGYNAVTSVINEFRGGDLPKQSEADDKNSDDEDGGGQIADDDEKESENSFLISKQKKYLSKNRLDLRENDIFDEKEKA